MNGRTIHGISVSRRDEPGIRQSRELEGVRRRTDIVKTHCVDVSAYMQRGEQANVCLLLPRFSNEAFPLAARFSHAQTRKRVNT